MRFYTKRCVPEHWIEEDMQAFSTTGCPAIAFDRMGAALAQCDRLRSEKSVAPAVAAKQVDPWALTSLRQGLARNGGRPGLRDQYY